MEWDALQKPAEVAESRLITAILSDRFPIGTTLPAERELAQSLGVTRPTLREALQRMTRDGWIEIQQGKSTRVRNYWQEGKLGVLSALALFPEFAPADFVLNLLAIRLLMAPSYTRLAVTHAPGQVVGLLQTLVEIEDRPESYATADWDLHHQLTVLSGNPIFTLILNGFQELYLSMAVVYFGNAVSRSHSQHFYITLLKTIQGGEIGGIELLTRKTMSQSLDLWQQALNNEDKVADLAIDHHAVSP